jgi:TonB family protein
MAVLTRIPEDSCESCEPVLRWPGLEAPPVRGRSLTISVLLHLAVLAGLFVVPRAAVAPAGLGRESHGVTILVAPPLQLTQRAPNRGKIGKEFSLESLLPRPALRAPRAIPQTTRVPPLPPPVALPEPPKVAMAAGLQGGAPPSSSAAPPPPPRIQTEEAKLAFETPGAPPAPKTGGLGKLALPADPIAEATRAAIRAGAGGVSVGDSDLSGSSGGLSGLSQAPSPGKTATALEMISDPMGVDFKPYLIRILATVKRNWLAVIPEAARLGRQGRVEIQFAIDRDGYVPKLVIAVPSGTESLDRAAVAGVSASNPFPPLPREFRGNQVRLQFTFSYNLK